MSKNKLLWMSVLVFVLAGCTVQKSAPAIGTTTTTVPMIETVMPEGSANNDAAAAEQQLNDRFVNAYTSWAINLFQKSVAAERGKNVVLSPLSIQMALGMTANGAVGNTQEEVLRVIGGDFSIDELNTHLDILLHATAKGTPSVLSLANAVWLRRDLEPYIQPMFSQVVADHYDAAVCMENFNTEALQRINAWVKAKTQGRIDSILDSIGEADNMYLLNAASFDDEWFLPYRTPQVKPGVFYTMNGETRNVSMMQQQLSSYHEDENVIGFTQRFKHNFVFSVLLPKEGIDVYEYIDGLTAEQWLATLDKQTSGEAVTRLPKFECESVFEMKEILRSMGIRQAFSANADFSGIWTKELPLGLANVRHKADIVIDEAGARAGAATATIVTQSVVRPSSVKPVEIVLDHPFVYTIAEAKTKIPIFIGVVTDVGK